MIGLFLIRKIKQYAKISNNSYVRISSLIHLKQLNIHFMKHHPTD